MSSDNDDVAYEGAIVFSPIVVNYSYRTIIVDERFYDSLYPATELYVDNDRAIIPDEIRDRFSYPYIGILNPIEKLSNSTHVFNNNTNEQCTICFNNIKKNTTIYVFYCFHFFCESCVVKFTDKSDKCPLCNEQIEPNDMLSDIGIIQDISHHDNFSQNVIKLIKNDLDNIN